MEEALLGEIEGSPFIIIHTKMIKVKHILELWSKRTFGNIFQKIATLEDVVEAKEIQLDISSSKKIELL